MESNLGQHQETRQHTEVRINPFGQIVIDGKNFTGDACSLMGGRLAKAAGAGSGDTETKPEFFQTSTQDLNQQNW